MPLNKEKLENIVEKNCLEVVESIQSNSLARASAITNVPRITHLTSAWNCKLERFDKGNMYV